MKSRAEFNIPVIASDNDDSVGRSASFTNPQVTKLKSQTVHIVNHRFSKLSIHQAVISTCITAENMS